MEKRAQILIAGDAQANCELLRSSLNDYLITDTTDGKAALKLVQNEPPDLILLDRMLPDIDGHSVLSILKNNESTRHIPVILLASLDAAEDKIISFDKGADEYIAIPFNPPEIKARVRALLRVKSMQDELANIPWMLASLVCKLEAYHQITVQHSLRTTYYAESLAKLISHQKTDHERIRLAALLHDIGYIDTDLAIRQKNSPLSEAELIILQAHPVHSEEICAKWPGLQLILPWIRHHHERFDGLGYPDKLAGTDIPIGARILAIADSFDALTNTRPNRPAYSQYEALRILQEDAGQYWDPEYVALFCQLGKNTDLCTQAKQASINDFANLRI